jgi:hypothetical protein
MYKKITLKQAKQSIYTENGLILETFASKPV